MNQTKTNEMTHLLRNIRKDVTAICHRLGRDEDSVLLIGASKTQSHEAIYNMACAGLFDFGENYEQELSQKKMAVQETDSVLAKKIRWHFIGTLQRRKVRKLIDEVVCIHSLDRLDVALEMEKRAGERGIIVDTLIQINTGAESTKSGIRPDDLPSFLRSCQSLDHIRIIGLMALPPYEEEPEKIRPHFRCLRELRDAMNEQKVYRSPLQELSMGMSHDYQIAIEEGSTMIRLGTALFGSRRRT